MYVPIDNSPNSPHWCMYVLMYETHVWNWNKRLQINYLQLEFIENNSSHFADMSPLKLAHAFPHFQPFSRGRKKETKRLLEQSIVRLAAKSKLRETQTLTMIQVWPHKIGIELGFVTLQLYISSFTIHTANMDFCLFPLKDLGFTKKNINWELYF